jgi:hypothetical protein
LLVLGVVALFIVPLYVIPDNVTAAWWTVTSRRRLNVVT